jgi:hypothetical protein
VYLSSSIHSVIWRRSASGKRDSINSSTASAEARPQSNTEAIGVVRVGEGDEAHAVTLATLEDNLAFGRAICPVRFVPDEMGIVDERGVAQGLVHGRRRAFIRGFDLEAMKI